MNDPACGTLAVPPAGGINGPLFLIGQSPGADEVIKGMPFTGKSGAVIRDAMAMAGIMDSEWWVSNIVKCHPPANRANTPDEIATCREWWKQELALVRPRVLIAIGVPAKKEVCRIFKSPVATMRMLEWEKEVIPIRHPYLRLAFSIRHPSWALRNGKGEEYARYLSVVFRRALEKVSK